MDTICNSSLIQSYSYDQDQSELIVTFKSNQQTWRYSKVYKSEVDSIFATPSSIGTRFHQVIKKSGRQAERVQ
jgi:hypothetical protein